MDKCDNCGREYDETLYYRCPECNPYNATIMDENEYVLSPLVKVKFDIKEGFVKFIDTGDNKCEVWLSHTEYKTLVEIIKERWRFQ